MSTDSASARSKRGKAGFWCPDDILKALKEQVEKGTYDDQSKAIIGNLRKGILLRERFPEGLRKRIEELASLLQRDPDAIINLCVEGILMMMEAMEPVTPLIVEEVYLRRKRKDK